MADRFWVGNGGNTNDTAHWSTTSGGSSGASVPTSADRALWDANSITLPGQIVTVNATFNCLDMIWTGVTNNPTLAGNSDTNLYGSLTLIAAMTLSYSGQFVMLATSTGKTITSAGLTFGNGFLFNGIGGGWTLQDDLNIAAGISHSNGTINTNGKTVTCTTLTSSNTNTRSFTTGGSIFNISGNWTFTPTTGLTFSSGTSVINMTGSSTTFAGGGLTYYNVNLIGNNITVSGSNTFNLLTSSSGNTLIFTSSTTCIALTNFVFKNNTIRSTVAGTPFTLSKSSGVVVFRACSLKDITGTGGASFSAIRSSINVSGNTGITFGSYVVVEKQLDGRKYILNASGVLTAL